jgi:transposase-like protein
MAPHRTYSTEFKRRVAQDYIAGESLSGLARRHGLSRNLIHIWVQKLEAGAFTVQTVAASTIESSRARIAALERLVGRQALEIEFLKGALKNLPRARSETMSIVTGPPAFPSREDVG